MAIIILGPDLVLAVVAPQRLLDLEDRVVVGVGDLDPGVLLGDEGGLLLSDEALPLSPGLVSYGFSDNINRPAVGSSNLGYRKLLKLKSYISPLMLNSTFPKLSDSQRTLSFI